MDDVKWFTDKVRAKDNGYECSLCGNPIRSYSVLIWDDKLKRQARFHQKQCWAKVYRKIYGSTAI